MMMDIFVNKLIFIRKGWNHCRKIIREMCCFGKKYCEKLFRVGSSCCRCNSDWSDSNFLTTEHRLMQRLRIFHLVWTLTPLILPHKEKANKFRTTQLGLSILLRSPLHAIFPIKCITIMKLTVMLWILRVWDHHSVLSPFTIVK